MLLPDAYLGHFINSLYNSDFEHYSAFFTPKSINALCILYIR